MNLRKCRLGVLALTLAVVLVPAALAEAQDEGLDPATESGREMVHFFYSGELQPLWDRMSDEMLEGLGSMETFDGFRTQVSTQLGGESELVSEEVSSEQGMIVYTRKARFANSGDTIIDVVFVTDGEGTITGFWIRPAQ